MKIKLLRKLRSRFIIQKRNNEYRYFDTVEKDGGVYNCSEWTTDLKKCREIRRNNILENAENYKKAKTNIN